MAHTPAAIALVPARAGSTRLPGKNVRKLAGHPLLAYSIQAARESGIFDAIVCSTDSTEIAAIAARYGAEVPVLRPAELAGACSPDIEWVVHMLELLADRGRAFELFAILRPTSPFRSASTIRAATEQLISLGEGADSIRAVELCRQHPGKMWVLEGDLMHPLLPQPSGETPYHSSQYQALPKVYVQNSSLEVAWTRVATVGGTIAGDRVAPYLTDRWEGFTIDYPEDWQLAEQAVAAGEVSLPEVREPAACRS